MITKDEALKLALEALEKLWNIIDDIDTYGDMAKVDEKLYRSLVERRQRTRFEETGISTDGYTLDGGAITAIRAALASKSEALAEQPAQEPVAWGMPSAGGGFVVDCITPEEHDRVEGGYTIPLYTSPPYEATPLASQRSVKPFVGLTDAEFQWIYDNGRTPAGMMELTEAKLKEKNDF